MNFITFSSSKILLLSFLLVLMANYGGFAQVSETRAVGSFSKISASSSIELIIKKGDSERVEIEASNLNSEDIKTEIKGQTLYLGLQSGNYRNVKLKMTVTYRQLKQIDTQGAIQLKNQGVLQASDFVINVTGSSKVALSLNVENLVLNCSGAGSLHLDGKASKQKITLSGAANVAAFDLITKDTEITVSGAGNIDTYASQKLVASVSGAGNISYKGNPAETQFKQSGSGKIMSKK